MKLHVTQLWFTEQLIGEVWQKGKTNQGAVGIDGQTINEVEKELELEL